MWITCNLIKFMINYLYWDGGISLKIFLLIISLLLIAIVLLQSNKAESASQIISGGNSDLFSKRKERGLELLISRITLALGMIFFLVSLVAEFA